MPPPHPLCNARKEKRKLAAPAQMFIRLRDVAIQIIILWSTDVRVNTVGVLWMCFKFYCNQKRNGITRNDNYRGKMKRWLFY